MSEILPHICKFFPRPIRIKFGIDDLHTIPFSFCKFREKKKCFNFRENRF